ncbi:hypothetical protein [Ammoniphilus oxalaticus]|uniref:DUF7210 family protein n=1 Tax=Ammoniphilus oxalaticus TaxID=66863 RepID=UPI0011C3D211|nr:hypothetical protein [Ammoniphilus oxalaticus]
MDVKATGVIKHGGKWFQSGDAIKKIKKEDGERLIFLGVAKELIVEAPQPEKEVEEPVEEKEEKKKGK